MLKKYRFTLTGFMPLLMHADNIEGSDELSEWRKNPANKGVTVAGDDRSPGWTWQTYVYHDGEHVVMPAENVMVALRQAGAQMILKKQKTFKEITQSGLLIDGESCEFRNAGKQIPIAEIHTMRDLPFSQQVAACRKMHGTAPNGKPAFDLFVKRAKVGTSKHIRVRPRFESWTVTGEVMVLKPELTEDILVQLFDLAGKAGLCDWRPAGKTPGPYGQASATVVEVK